MLALMEPPITVQPLLLGAASELAPKTTMAVAIATSNWVLELMKAIVRHLYSQILGAKVPYGRAQQ